MRVPVGVWGFAAAIAIGGGGFALPAFATGSAYCNGRTLSVRLVLSHESGELGQLEVWRDQELLASYAAADIAVERLDRATKTVVLRSAQPKDAPELSLAVEGGEGPLRFRGREEKVSCDLAI